MGASGESSVSAATPFDNSALSSGAAYVFTSVAAVWSEVAYMKASTVVAGDAFGAYVTINDDGSYCFR